jgi:hypothetical protein
LTDYYNVLQTFGNIRDSMKKLKRLVAEDKFPFLPLTSKAGLYRNVELSKDFVEGSFFVS